MSHEPMKPADDADFTNTTHQIFDDLKEQLSDAAGNAKAKASDKLNHQRRDVAEGLDKFASVIRDKASSVPGGSRAANLSHSIANSMEATASYLRDHDFYRIG